MTREEQDKLWAELSEESKKRVTNHYYGDTAGTGSQFEDRKRCYERIFGKHNLKPKLTYEDVARELFDGKCAYYGLADGVIQEESHCMVRLTDSDLCTSERQVLKIEAINKLLNVAKFLNKNEDGSDWVPDWNDITPDEKVWGLGLDENTIRVYYIQKHDGTRCEIVYFRTKELVQQAIEILGEDTIRTALTTEY